MWSLRASALGITVALGACGGGSSSTPVTVRVAPATVTVPLNSAPVQFTATVSGTSDRRVTWRISGAGSSLLSTAGVLQSMSECSLLGTPMTIIATSVAEPSAIGAAQAIVGLPPLSPSALVMPPKTPAAFTVQSNGCDFPNLVNYTFNWSIAEGAAGGTLTGGYGDFEPQSPSVPVASYTSPGSPGTYHAQLTLGAATSAAPIEVRTPLSNTGSLNICRTGHTATLLNDGRVLIVGGVADPQPGGPGPYFMHVCGVYPFQPIGSAELYDPAKGAFTLAATPIHTRSGQAATLLPNGSVLLTGGADNTAEIYDPATGVFSATGPMTTARRLHNAVLLADGLVLITGSSATAELFNPAAQTFTATGPPIAANRVSAQGVLLNDGRVLIAGGVTNPGVGPTTTAELYDPKSSGFAATGDLVSANPCASALLPSGKVLLVGSGGAQTYDPASGTFTATAGPMALTRFACAATTLASGRVIVAGGVVQPESIFLSGGDVPVLTSIRIDAFQTEIYDPVTDSFTAGNVIYARYGLTATTLHDGTVLLAGGGPLAAELGP